MIHRTVREWEYLEISPRGDGNSVTREQADRLVEAASAVKIAGAHGERILENGLRYLRAQQIVGVIAAGDVTLEILPKIEMGDAGNGRRTLVHMLARTLDLDPSEGGFASMNWQRHSLIEILIRLYCDRLFHAVRQGLPRLYRGCDGDRPFLIGRLDAKRQFTTLAVTHQMIACHHDELASDVPLNQIIKATVSKLRRLAATHGNQRRLRELAFAFADVRPVPPDRLAWNHVILDRTNGVWGRLLQFSKLLLDGKFQTSRSGDVAGFALLFPMNRLFEKFVAGHIRECLRGSEYRVFNHGPRKMALAEIGGSSMRIAMRPDLVIVRGGRPVLILDVKWKGLRRAGSQANAVAAPADVYQMMAYAQIYGCARTVLFYPHTPEVRAEPGAIAEHRIVGTEDSRIGITTLSLNDPETIATQIARLLSTALEH